MTMKERLFMPAATDTRLTPSEAARVAGVSVDTVRGWLRAGRLPYEATKYGALIDAGDLGRVIAQREALARERRTGSGGKGRA